MRIDYANPSHRIDNTPPHVIAPPFDPTDMANLWAWFDPTQGVTTVSGAVSQWVDAAFGLTVSQATAGNRPSFSSTAVNGFPGLTMASTADHWLISTTTSTTSLSCITIGSATNAAGTASTIVSSNNTSTIQFRINNHQLDILQQGTADIGASTTTVADATLAILVFTVSQGASGTFGFRVNGTADATSGTNTRTFATGPFGLFHNFSSPGTGETFNGSIGDIILTSAVSSLSDLQKAEGYLAWKYSVTSLLPSGHPYKSAPP